MSEFLHSEVLFSGDDGLPLQFNIQNTTEKELLKNLIEHGGGICTLSDEAIILVSPGTKVLSVLPNKNLISTRYIFDCIKENFALDTDEYRIEINEVEASDFSDSSNLVPANSISLESNKKLPDDILDYSVDILQPVQALSPQKTICHNSNHDFDFQDSENHNAVVEVLNTNQTSNSHLEIPLESSENHIHFGVNMNYAGNSGDSANVVPETLEIQAQAANVEQKKLVGEQFRITENRVGSDLESPADAVVSSSQEKLGALDQFDNMVLNKVQENPVMDEEALSQSYTVSSSADAQISPNQQRVHDTSAEIFSGNSAVPDSASQTTERMQYINNLEKEIEKILKKPSPKSIQDKITLVKYICIVKKLAPAIVLKTLQKF